MNAPSPLDPRWFEAPVCRNCGTGLTGPYCASCGQKKAERLGLKEVWSEVWDKFRWFEKDLAISGTALFLKAGTTARNYALGARKRYTHPLKLLFAAIVLLLLTLSYTRYIDSSNASVNKAMELVKTYSQWSFSIGLLAIFITSLALFHRKYGFNFVEHLVLAMYTHTAIIGLSIVAMLPAAFLGTPDAIRAYRTSSGYFVSGLEVALVLLAFSQFFGLKFSRDWWRLALAAGIFYGLKQALLYAYAWGVVKIVLKQLAQ